MSEPSPGAAPSGHEPPTPAAARGLSGPGAVAALAGAGVAGALWAQPFPLLAAAALTAVGLLVRRAPLLVVGVLLLVSTLAARSWAGIDMVASAPWSGVATLVTDPEVDFGAVHAVVEIDGRRVEAWARGGPGSALRGRLAGERLWTSGTLGPLRGSAAARLATRHVVGRLDVSEVGGWSQGAPVPRLANDLRRLLMAGTASFSAEQRSLFAGLVLGDDREQGPGLAAAFEGAGLTHLLAVSGQNVAFLLAVLAPLLRRLRLWPRFAATLGALGFFALTTRFEPSVLRAVVMAGIGALALTLGRPVSSLQVLCLAVTALLAVDPLLVHQVGFQLSVLATFGIVTLATPIARWLPLPRVMALPAAVTLAAQLATAPLLVARFGPVPVAALPANLLAEPAAAGAMMYGLAAGPVAGALTGLMGPLPAAVIHLPTRMMIWWLAGVARWGAEVPLGHLGGRELVLLAAVALLVGAAAVRRRGATTPALWRFRAGGPGCTRGRGHGQGPSGTFGSVRAPPADPP